MVESQQVAYHTTCGARPRSMLLLVPSLCGIPLGLPRLASLPSLPSLLFSLLPSLSRAAVPEAQPFLCEVKLSLNYCQANLGCLIPLDREYLSITLE